jgi:hypothetical protein
MKTKLPLFAATYLSLCAVGSAFTLDFVSVPTGTGTPPTLTVSVPGYGTVQFDAIGPAILVVDDRYATPLGVQTSPSLNFDGGESVKITFIGNDVINSTIRMGTVDVNIDENFQTVLGGAPNEYVLTLVSSTGNGAGLYNIKFDAIPEPSASLLGLIGASILVLRRRR